MSFVTLYKGCKLQPQHNFIIDDIDRYLLTLDSDSFSNVQFIRPALQTSLKIVMSSTNLSDFLPKNTSYNYLKVEQTNAVYYYFIISKEWNSASSSIELILQLDTLNTFREGISFNYTERTHIKRRHFERFSGASSSEALSTNYRRLIGFESEGFNLPVISTSEFKIEDESILNQSFYSVLKTQIDDNVTDVGKIQVQLTTEKATKFKEDYAPFKIIYNDFNVQEIGDNKLSSKCYWFLTNQYNGLNNSSNKKVININGSDYELENGSGLCIYASNVAGVYVTRFIPDSQVFINVARFSNNEFEISNVQEYYVNTVELKNKVVDYDNPLELMLLSKYDPSTLDKYYINALNFELYTNINLFDRTQSNISSIIQLPYCPADFKLDNDALLLNPVTSPYIINIDESIFELKDLNSSFKHKIEFEKNKSPFRNLFASVLNFSLPTLKNLSKNDSLSISLESKLFHSDYYYNKLIYDSENYIIRLENYNNLNYTYNSFTADKDSIYFKFTNTFKSRFLFEIPLLTDSSSTYNKTLDYEGILVSNRNNESTLFNSAYLNYIRTAYNYDLKSKERSQTSAWVNVGLNIAGTVASIATTAVSGGFTASTAVSYGANTVSSIYNALTNEAQQQQNIEAKLYQSAMQGVNVSGADDLDLFNYYSGNKAKFVEYTINEYYKKLVYDLFFYTGYKCDEYAIPLHNTRNRFDYLQADADFELLTDIRQEFISDLKNKISEGVTYIHRFENSWDFLQQYNNIESIFL